VVVGPVVVVAWVVVAAPVVAVDSAGAFTVVEVVVVAG